ncbi:F-box protein At2g26160-like [Lolium perenne]|uniref:F-box protein At2g26160-like n=1 Tax=Lolium perenne TaxID=4522 RepID=UPI0021EAABA3|nr:uncharacterized protein LOC127319621 [Lolium perenne]
MAPRSWSALETDLGDIILRRLQHHADRVRFGAVCRQWRSLARRNDPPSQLFPWLALPNRTFYSLPDSAFQPLPLYLERHRQLPHAQSSCGEWLVFERMDGAYTLVNPFSMSTTMVLPRLSTEPHFIGDPPPFMSKLVVCSPNLVAAVVGAGWPHRLALCRPGAASWSWADDQDQVKSLQDMIWHRGKLYALDGNHGRLLSVSIGEESDTGEPTVSRVDVLVEAPRWQFIESPLQYLLESDGALLMVRREDPNIQNSPMVDDFGALNYAGVGLDRATEFKVFQADLAQSRWTELSSVGEDRVLFVQGCCSRAVPVPDRCKDYVTGDRIFFLSDAAARPYYRKNVSFCCSIYDMRKRRSHTYLRTKVRPLKGFPVVWLFRGSDVGV